jgi:hypothetical protein
MGGKVPRLIITDEDASMKVAIGSCFPGSIHRFCMWHIMEKMLRRLAIQQIKIHSFGMIWISVYGVLKQNKDLRCVGMSSWLVMVYMGMNGWLIGITFESHELQLILRIYPLQDSSEPPQDLKAQIRSSIALSIENWVLLSFGFDLRLPWSAKDMKS